MEVHKIRERIERWVRKIRVRLCPTPFVLFFRERSGSTYLCSLLDNHPQITCRTEDFHEVFVGDVDNPKQRRDKNNWARRINCFDNSMQMHPSNKDVISHLYDLYSFPTVACGFKLKFWRQFTMYPEVLEEFGHIKNLRVIVLTRENVLKQAVSKQNLKNIQTATGTANLFGKDRDQLQQFELDIDAVFTYMRTSEKDNASLAEKASEIIDQITCPSLHVKYEDLLNDQKNTVSQIFDFLNVDPSLQIEPADISKATPDRLADAISNFDELVEAVKDTKYYSMLE